MKKYYIICTDVESAWKKACFVFPTKIMINNKYCLDFTDKQFIFVTKDNVYTIKTTSDPYYFYKCYNPTYYPYSEGNMNSMINWIRNMIKDRIINEAEGKTLVVKPKLISWILPEIKKVIYNNPATIVIWEDRTKTVVKAEDEDYDPEKGLAMAIAKKAYGNQGNYYNEFKKWLPKES